MILNVDYLRTDPSGILIYRRKFPRELVRHIPGRSLSGSGRVEFKKSIRAKSLNDPGAMDRYRSVQEEFQRIVEEAQRLVTRSYDALDDQIVEFLAQSYRRDLLKDDDDRLWKRPFDHATYETRGSPEEVYEECREMLEEHDAVGLVRYWKEWACTFARAKGYLVDQSDVGIVDLSRALAEAACEVWLALDRRMDKRDAPTPAKPQPPDRDGSPSASFPTLQAVADGVMASKMSNVGQSTLEAWSTALRFFREVHGTPQVNLIDRRMVAAWLDLLSQKPVRVPKESRAMALPELIAAYDGDEDVDRLSRKTLRGHLAALATIWTKAEERGVIEGIVNPFKARKDLAGGDTDQGAEFTMAELQAIFDLPVFTKRERPTRGRGDASYWMPLLLLWTGVRPEEAAQLLVSDFEQDAERGHWLMTVTDEGEHPVKGKRSLKTERHGPTGRRTFVVPAALQELGLIRYVERLRAQGELALFPLLTLKNKKRGHLYPSVAEWWGEYIRSHGVELQGRGRRPYRDFRQTWATAAREAGIPEEAMSYLMGHSNKRGPQTRSYGKNDAHGWRMADVAYPKLDFSRLLPWQP